MIPPKVSETDYIEELKASLTKLAKRNQAELGDRLVRLLTLVVEEATVRPSFARKLAKILNENRGVDGGREALRAPAQSRRRPAGVLDPFEVYKESDAELRLRLADLDVDQLKDIIAEHGMNRDKLAMKWKSPGRLIERIVETVKARASKGDVFRD